LNERLFPSAMLEALGRNGALEVEELYKSVQKLHGDLDRHLFDKLLMELEIQGLIRVYSMARDKRRIELVKG
jgi:hypothetical protein